MACVGVLALQGAVSEHCAKLAMLGHTGIAVKKPQDLEKVQALILPGGESTVISRLMQQNLLYEPIQEFAKTRQVLGTCAGLILCSAHIGGNEREVLPLKLIDIEVLRNNFGRQVDSFETTLDVAGVGCAIPAVFIRAPVITKVGAGVSVLASVNGNIVAAEAKNVLVLSFHPELAEDTRILQYFCSKIA